MGYSATAKALMVKDALIVQLRARLGTPLSSNGFGLVEDHPSNPKFFYEIGRERADGAVVGTVLRHIGDDRYAVAGSFHISPEGKIKRFPYSTKAERESAELCGRIEYARAYPPVCGVA